MLQMPQSAQIALVYPNGHKYGGGAAADPRSFYNAETISRTRAWHIDGVEKQHPDEIVSVHNFNVLFGIYLNDIADFAGNFTVFPGAPRSCDA